MAVAVLMVTQAFAVDFGDFQGFASASNLESAALYIGTNATDAEATNPTSGNGTTDDLTTRDDEDLTIPAFTVGSTTAVPVRVFLNTASFTSARLGLWVDWNGDGDVLDTNEALTVQSVTGTGNYTFNLTPPAGTVPGTKYLRVRVRSGTTAPTFSGASATTAGEVEDYPVTVNAAPVDPNAYQVLVANYGGNVNKHDSAGTFIAAVAAGSLTNPSELAAGADGNVIVSSEGASRIDRVNPNTNAFINTLIAAGSNGLSIPGGMVVGSDNVLYIGDYSTDKLFRFNAGTGAFIGTTTVGGPSGLSLDSNHKLIILSEDAARVDRYSTAGAFEATIHSFGAWMDAHGMAMDLAGNYYFCNQGASTVDRITPGGTRSTFATLDAGSVPFSISIGPDGNIWVGDVGHNQIEEFSSAGAFIGRYSTNVNNPCGILVMPVSASDFGDLPSTYPTRLAHNGARHIIGTLRMGTNLDADGAGLASTGGNGDDSDSDGDDEDGVTIPTLTAGATAAITVNSSGTGKINAFFDWNNDKDFLDSGEAITEMSVASGNNTLNVPVPAAAVAGTLIGARFRLSTAGALTATGGAVDGEVEDYLVTVIATTDFGDWNGASAATTTTSSTANANLRLGAAVDTESAATTNATATGDDTTGTDDEDGVAVPCRFIAGAPSSLYLVYTNATASNAFINAWVDFNGNGSFADAGEQVATNHTAMAGLSGAVAQILFNVPSTATVGTAGVRVRLTSVTSPGATGAAGTGEIEDYAVPVVAAGSSGASPLLDYNVIARNNLSVVSDVEGRMIMKNLTSTSSVTMAKNLVGYPAATQSMQVQTSVAAGSSINLQYGSLYIPSSGALNGRVVNYNGGGSLQTTPAPDFTGIFAGIVSASTSYAAMTANNTINVPGSPAPLTLNVTAMDANRVAIFSIDGNTLLNNGNVQSIDINLNGNNPDAILINCTGTSISYSASGNFIGNFVSPLIRPKILWNFPSATSLTLGKSFYGSILAPNASVSATAGAVEGSVACNNLTSNIEIHLPVFQGCIIPPALNDFGDWNGSGAATTTTSSIASTNIRLGSAVDTENSVTPDTAASADGTDEDGVTMPASITPGVSATIPVRVFNNNTANRFLEAWIDFDGNGTFNDVDVTTAGGERIYNAATPASASLQTINVTFTVPASAVGGRWAGARFRISDNSATTPTSSGATGEIEDYVVCVNAPTLIEWDMNTGHYNVAITPNFVSPCLTGGVFQMFATSPLPFISDDPAGVNGPSKGGVGLNEAAPGDGFATLRCGQGFPSAFDAGMQTRPRANLTARVAKTWCQFTTVNNISSGSITGFVMDIARQGPESPTHVQGYLTWFDGTTHRTAWTAAYALEPAYYDPGSITNNHPAWRKINLGAFNAGGDALPTGAALSGRTFLLELHIYGDSGAATDTLEFDNFALLGSCARIVDDFGDFSGFAAATQAAATAIRIGTLATDAESASPANSSASGDDLVGDDEDLTMPAFTVGVPTNLTVPITITSPITAAQVNVFVDWNGDGDVGDTGETQTAQAVTATGNRTFTLTPPVGTTAGTKYLRIRLVEGSTAPGFSGTSALRGEVEDYAVTVTNSLSIGNLVWNDANNNGIKDAAETGINGVVMQLLRDTNGDGTIGKDELTVIATTTTATVSTVAGTYAFSPLAPGKYVVRVAGSNFAQSAALGALRLSSTITSSADNQTDNDDNGYQAISSCPTTSPVITLADGAEPTSGLTDNTVDFGFTTPSTRCKLAFICGEDKPQNADAFDHGLMKYIESKLGAGSVVPLLAKGSGTTLALYDPWATNTELTVTLTNYDAILVSASCYSTMAPNLVSALRDTTKPVLSLTSNIASVGMKIFSAASLHWSDSAWNGSATVKLTDYLTSNPTSSWSPVFESGTYYAEGTGLLWPDAANQAARTGGIFVSYPAGSLATRGAAASHGFRVHFGISLNGTQENPSNAGQPVLESEWLDPLSDWTPAGKSYFDRAFGMVIGSCISDYGDYPLFASASQVESGELWIGTNATDSEATNPTTGTATVDNNTGVNDEDLTMPSFLVGTATTLSIPVSVPKSNFLVDGTSRINVFVDWNGDNDVADTNETLTAQTVAATGTVNFSLTPPSGTTAGKKFLRIRLSESSTHPGFSGASALKGEVEDYDIVVVTDDYGDYSGFATATQLVNGAIRIGTLSADAESVSPANTTATGDDLVGDDEDLTMPIFTIGTATTLGVPITLTTASLSGGTSRIGVYADWNGDGDVADTNETLAVQAAATNGSSTLNFSLTPPTGTVPGIKYLRIRAAEGSLHPGFSGTSTLKGEVEDYAVSVGCTTMAITPATLPNGAVNSSYSQPLTATPALANFWEVISGTLPPGLSLSPSTGALTGTPTTMGTYNFTVTATEQLSAGNGQLVATTYNLDLNPGNTFNIRDYLYDKDFPNRAIDWSKVTFYYVTDPSPSGWNLTNFNGGLPVTVSASDETAGGNEGTGRFRIFWKRDGQATEDDNMTIRVSSGVTSVVTSAKTAPPIPAACSGIRSYSVVITAPLPFDLGDWNGIGAATTTTSSVTNSNLRIGATLDSETTMTPNATANADGADEDGIYLPAMRAGSSPVISVRLHNQTGAAAFLNAWTDFNNDGDFGDVGEQVITNSSIPTGLDATVANNNPPSYSFKIAVPANAVTGAALGMRFRLTDVSGTGPTGSSGAGEVEDYIVTLQPACVSNLLTNSSFEQGTTVIAGPRTSASATDQLIGPAGWTLVGGTAVAETSDNRAALLDDYHLGYVTANQGASGSMFQDASVTPGNTHTLTFVDGLHEPALNSGSVSVQYLTSANATISGYSALTSNITYDMESLWPFTSMSALKTLTLPPAPPTAAKVRVTISFTRTGAGWDAAKVDGLCLTSTVPPLDYGDFSTFGAATQASNADIRIGISTSAATDAEAANPANATASGDDAVGDDEDLTMPAFTIGTATTLTVPVTVSSTANLINAAGRVGVWADWNGDGDVSDTGETLTVQSVASAGTTNLNFSLTPPLGVTPGTRYLRIRATEGTTSPAFSSTWSLKGEVEDYPVTVNCQTITVTAPSLPGWFANRAYPSATFTSSGGFGTITWSQTGALPPGMNFSTGGVLSGTPTAEGSYTFTARAQDQSGCAGTATVTVVIGSMCAVTDADKSIYVIDPASGGNAVVTTHAAAAGNFTAVAMDPVSGDIFYVVNGAASPRLGRFTLSTRVHTDLGQISATMVIQNLGFFNGAPHFVPNSTDDLQQVVLSGSAIASVTKMADLNANTNYTTVGDLSMPVANQLYFTAGNAILNYNMLSGVRTTFRTISTAVNPTSLAGTGGTTSLRAFYPSSNQLFSITATAETVVSTMNPSRVFVDTCGGDVAHATTDFGDWAHVSNPTGAATTTASSVLNGNLRLGSTVDAETTVSATSTATADDSSNTGAVDDEDGVTMPSGIMVMNTVTIPVSVLNNTGSLAYLHSWIDLNNDGVFANAVIGSGGERLVAAQSINTSGTAQAINVTFTVPTGIAAGSTVGARFRLTSDIATTPTVVAGIGETEDYVVQLQACPVIAAISLPNGVAGTAYAQGAAFSVSPVVGSTSWTATGLPSGLSLGSGTGLITGTTTQVGSFRVNVTATNTNGCVASRVFPLRITGCGTTNVWEWDWDSTVDTLNGGNEGGVWRTLSFAQDLATGNLAVTATMDVSTNATQGLWFMINNGPDPTSTDPTYAAVYLFNGSYYVTPYAANPTTTHTLGTIITSGTYTTSLVGNVRTFSLTLPVNTINSWAGGGATWKGIGFPLNAQGNAAGNSTSPYRIGVWARSFADGSVNYNTSTKAWTVTWGGGADPNIGTWDLVDDFQSPCCPLVIKPATLPSGSTGIAYTTTTFDADWGLPGYSYSISAGSLPPGLTLVGGVLSGTPNTAGTYNFTVRANDSGLCTGTQAYTVTIAASPLTLGNLIFLDNNNNTRYDAGDAGVPGVVVQLYNSSNALVSSTTTLNTTTSSPVATVEQAHSSVWIDTLAGALSCLSGTNRSAYWSGTTARVNYLVPGDTDGRFTTGNTDFPTGSSQGYVIRVTGNLTVPTTGTYTFGMTLDDVGRLRINGADVIVDDNGLHSVADRFGSVSLTAGTHTFEMIYLGVWGGSVELYAQSGTHTSWNTGFKLLGDTASGGYAISTSTPGADTGKYLFTGLSAGSYYVKIPASEFAVGKPLYRKESVLTTTATPTDDNRDDNSTTGSSDDGIDVADPTSDGVRSPLIALSAGAEPLSSITETGFYHTDDNAADANGNLTVDFGFRSASNGCWHFSLRDTNYDDWFETNVPPQSTNFTQGGVVTYIDTLDMTYHTGTKRFTYDATFVQKSGKRLDGFYYIISNDPEPFGQTQQAIMYVDVFDRSRPKVTLYVYDPALYDYTSGDTAISYTNGKMLASSQTANSPISVWTTESGSVLQVHIAADFTTVNNHLNFPTYGLTSAWEGFAFDENAGIWSHYYDLVGAPVYNASTFQITNWNYNPNDFWGTVSYVDTHDGTPIFTENICEEKVGVGNLVYRDTNGDGNYDSGEGVDNVLVYLYRAGQSAGLDLPLAALLTTGGGEYFFNGISPGSYFLHIPSSEFGAGKPLVGTMSLPGTGTGDDHLDEDGLDVVSPSTSGVSTAVFTLTANAEPTDADSELGFDKTGDNVDDNNSDLTIDFGFRTATSAGLGNLVFIDSNANGRYDGADTGVGGVKVELVNSSSGTVVATTTTDSAPVPQTGFLVTQMNTGSTVVSTYAAANTQLASANASNSQTVIAQNLNYYTAGTDGRFPTGNAAFPMGSFSNFLVRATGVITIPSAGTWTFGMSSDDGGRLRINGADVIVDDTQHPVADRFGSRTLTAGTHTIEVTYWAFSGNDVLEVYATAGSFTSWTSSFKLIGDTANGGLPVVTTSSTNTAGRYLFSGVAAGTYFLRIPSSEFASGKALFGYASFNNGSPTDDQKDDNSLTGSSDSGIDSISPTTLGIVTAPITLTLGSEPTNAGGETGFLGTQDDAFDSNYDLTADFALIPAAFDFGDWAHTTNPTGAATTTTKSMVTGTLRLGAAVDAETSVTPNAAATADGADDDAVTIPATITEGQIVNLNVSLLNNTGANATLSLWVDYDNDGVFNDSVFSFASAPTGEKVTTPLTVTPSSSTQSVALSFPVPVTASPGAQRGLRLRLSSDGGVTTPTGEGGSGEIEDYVVRICPADLIQPETAQSGRLGTPYLQTFTAPAGTTPLVWSATGSVPGLTFNTATAELSGIPSTEGVFTLRVTVTDANGCSDTNAYSIVIGGGNGMQCPDPLSEVLGTSGRRWGYSASGPPYEPGLSILAPYANEGVLAGTSMRLRGASVAAITYTNTNCITSASRTTPALGGSGRYFRDTFAGVTSGTVSDTDTQTSGYSCWMPNFGSGYQFTLSVTPAKAVTPAGIYWESIFNNITFSDVLVNGVSVATNIGPVASGMVQADTAGTQMPNYYYFVPFTAPMNAGTSYTITLRASGGIDPVIGDFSLLGCCACSSIALSPAGPALPAGTVGVSYSTSVAGTGGQTPYYYSVISGALPTGMKLDPSSGAIFGTPDTAGTASFTIEARDANDCTGTAAYTISVVASTTDYGDLPDTGAGTATGNYQTLSTDSGASHTLSANLRLGLTVDGEVNGQPNAFATGDGADDDGVTSWPFFQRGATVNIPVSLFNNLAAARLYAFIDWNNNGSFADANEVISAVTVGMNSVQQTVNVPVTVPAGATLGCVGLRLRLATATTLTATGNTGNGEVEDYFVTVLNSGSLQDYGDHLYGSLANSASNVASSAIYIGASIPDGESADPSNTGSNADDLAGNDEDYDNFGTISSGGISGVNVDVTQCSALATGSFGIWVDWNGDNDFADTHEVVTMSTTLTPGLNSLPFVFICPAGTTPGVKYVRMRAQQGSTTPSPTGVSTTLFGEVEDGTITVVAASEDRGDCMMFSDATATVNSNLRLGSVATDADTYGSVNASASVDDGTGADDEDGVGLYTAYASGMSSQITIVVTNNTGSPAYLSGWIDFNNTPGTIEANEVVISNITIPTGLTNAVQTYSFTVPAGITTTRDVCARFRLSSVSGTGISGSGGNGEVEDYLVRVCPVQACGVTGIVKN